MEYLAIGGLIGLIIYTASKQTGPIVIPKCSDMDIAKYNEKLNDILEETRNKVKGVGSGYTTRIDDSRFGRTGYHDEDEWKTYRSILYQEGIMVNRMDHTGLDSAIKVSVI